MNPLDQLADIQLPNDVSFWPLAWPYWVLIGLGLALCIYIAALCIKQRKWNKMKRQTLVSLQQIDPNAPYFEHKLQVIVKNVCAHYFSEIAEIKNKTLHTAAWQAFLLNTYQGKRSEQLKQSLEQINASLYGMNTNGKKVANPDVKLCIIDWLNTSIKRNHILTYQVSEGEAEHV